MRKRLISLGVCLCILTSLCTGYFATTSASATTENNVNKNMLEAMLNNRSWVIDTLINDDYSTNPHAMVNDMANEKSMMATVLSQYGNKNDPNYSAAYKAVVDAIYAWHHAGDYAKDVADYATEWTADIFEFFGGSDNAVSALRRCADSSKTMQYDNILQEVLKADYTSSSGQTLKGSNSQLVQLRKIQDGVGMLKSFASASKNLSGLDDGMAHTAASYADTVLFPAADAYQDVMNNVAKLTSSDMGENEQALLDLTTALGAVAVYDSIVVSENNSGGAITIAPAYLLDEDTKKIIDINADAAKFADITIDSFMYVCSIQTQKESVAGVLDRTSEHLANAQTRDLLDRYSDLIKDAADGKTSNYDLILTSIRNSGYIEKYAESKISDALKKMRNRFIPCYDQSIIPGAIASATGVVGTATYLADAVTGLEDTSTKTVELKNLNQLIAFFKATFERDLANYKANPTDENAAKVIDDLDFIQRLRLRGETIAYKMSANQLDKPLGQLLAGGSDETLKDFYAYDYQRHIDAILGASIVPYTTDTFTVNNGETFTIQYNDNCGGLYATYDKANGSQFNHYGIAELNSRISNGLTIEKGGKILTFLESADAYIPYITNNGGDIIVAKGMNVSEFTQSSGNSNFASGDFAIDYFSATGGKITSSLGTSSIQCSTLNLSNAVVESIPIICNGTSNISGNVTLNSLKANKVLNQSSGTLTLNGDLITAGDVHFGGSVTQNGGIFKLMGDLTGSSEKVTLGNVEVCGKLPQTISRDIYVNDFIVAAKKLTLNNKVYVSGDYQSNGKIVNSSNVIFAGNINEDIVYEDALSMTSDLVIDGDTVTAKKGIVLTGNLIIKNGGKLITKSLSVTNGSITLENNAELTINGKTTLSGSSSNSVTVDESSQINFNKLTIIKNIGNIVVNGNLKFGGDVSITSAALSGNGNIYLWCDLIGSSLTIDKPNNFYVVGKTPQTLSCSGANFNNITISNNSRSGVKFSSSVNCYGEYNANGSNVLGTVTQK